MSQSDPEKLPSAGSTTSPVGDRTDGAITYSVNSIPFSPLKERKISYSIGYA